MLFCNRWYQESAGRVYFNMSREKTRSHARHAARSTALVQTWIDQSETLLLFFAETNQRQSCLQGSPELLIPLLYMRRRALGRDWAVCRGLFLGTETTKTKRKQPKPRREWQYNAEKHRGKASASRVGFHMTLLKFKLRNYRSYRDFTFTMY